MKKKEKRGRERTRLTLQLDVFDSNTEKIIGQLIDITNEGVRLLCDGQLQPDSICRLRIDFPSENENREVNIFEAKCVCCNIDNNINLHHAGLQFMNINSESSNFIRGIIQKYSENI